MSFDYAGTAQDALALLKEFGDLAAVSWAVGGDYDPTTGAPAAGVSVAVSAYGAVFPYSYREVGTQPDSLIQAGDKNLFLAALDVKGATVPEPPAEALVLFAGEKYRVKACKPIAPAGVCVVYDITIRK